MGCGSSKSVAADDCMPHKAVSSGKGGDAPQNGRNLARMSLAGTYNVQESFKLEQPSVVSSMGEINAPVQVSGNTVRVRYATVTQRGYYPDQPTKINQDAVLVVENIGGKPDYQLFGVFDGHGEHGTECSLFAAYKVRELINQSEDIFQDPESALSSITIDTNAELHKSYIDDSLSGTTACMGLLHNNRLHVANVGDSRAVLGEIDAHGEVQARDLSIDQTPFRPDECQRVKAAGARVLTLDQVEGIKDVDEQCWTNEDDCDGDPPRLWVPGATYPGTAFTRSIGDSAAEVIGVFAEPELSSIEITKDHPFLILASDGVWEFISSQKAVDVVKQFDNPQDAASALVAISYKAWLQRETRTDDISVVLLYFDVAKEDQ